MPVLDLLPQVAEDFECTGLHTVDGRHYQLTCEAWLAKCDRNKERVVKIFEPDLGPRGARIQLQRWRLFFMACAELFGFNQGCEWLVSHVFLRKATGTS
ncbi:MAG: hypothetical protein ACOCVU_07455 [Desulfohalobiaceae bacterium]